MTNIQKGIKNDERLKKTDVKFMYLYIRIALNLNGMVNEKLG